MRELGDYDHMAWQDLCRYCGASSAKRPVRDGACDACGAPPVGVAIVEWAEAMRGMANRTQPTARNASAADLAKWAAESVDFVRRDEDLRRYGAWLDRLSMERAESVQRDRGDQYWTYRAIAERRVSEQLTQSG